MELGPASSPPSHGQIHPSRLTTVRAQRHAVAACATLRAASHRLSLPAAGAAGWRGWSAATLSYCARGRKSTPGRDGRPHTELDQAGACVGKIYPFWDARTATRRPATSGPLQRASPSWSAGRLWLPTVASRPMRIAADIYPNASAWRWTCDFHDRRWVRLLDATEACRL